MTNTVTTSSQSYRDLRNVFPAVFQGRGFEATLLGIATGDQFLLDNSVSVFKDSFVATAEGLQLDILLGSRGFSRPSLLDISDDAYRNLWIKGFNNANLTQGILNVLAIGYLPVLTNASVLSSVAEPYDISSGGTLNFIVDGQSVTITITPANFNSSTAATAQEVAMEISSLCESGNINAYAEDYFDEHTNTTKIRLYSNTVGSQGSMQVIGGQIQNALQFESPITNTQDTTTQFTITANGNLVKYAWTSGTKPPLSSLLPGYYVNIYGTDFNSINRGSYFIKDVVNSSLTDGSGYFTYESNYSYTQVVNLTSSNSILYFDPVKERVYQQSTFATVSQIQPNSSTVYIPATTDLLHRDPTTGGSFLTDNIFILDHTTGTFLDNETIVGQTSGASGYVLAGTNASTSVSMLTNTNFTTNEVLYGEESAVSCTFNSSVSVFNLTVTGPFLFDATQPEVVNFTLTLGQTIFPNQSLTAIVVSSTDNVSQTGFIYVGASLDRYEGPIPYNLAVGDLLITDGSYNFKYYHTPGELLNLTLIKTGTDILDYDSVVYAAIMSDVANARVWLEGIIEFIYPAGIELILDVLYPLQGHFISQLDIEYVYGDDSEITQNL